jgi:S1-C subfamily serine protease
MVMKERPVPYFFLVAIFFATVGVFFVDTKAVCAETVTLSPEPGSLQGEVSYSEEELSHILKHTTVRILQHVEGSVEIPSFIIDSEKKTVAIDPLKKPTVISGISENILGTGFFVSSDGYIATNAHFVSDAVSKTVIIDSFVKNAISEAVGKKKATATIDSLFTEEIVDFMLAKTKFNLTKTLIVLDPKTDPTTLTDETPSLYSLGFTAKEIATNDLFYKQGLDIALIKIEGEVFPASDLEGKEPIVGEKVYTFKTPSMSVFGDIASLAGKKPYEVSLLSAVVVRQGIATSTSVYYSDLTASPELSGAMVFDASGSVIGITSYDAQEDSSSVSILPGRAILEMLEKVSSTTSAIEPSFTKHVEKGIALSKELLCEEARVEFALAAGVQSSFVDSTIFDGYVTSCNVALAAATAEKANTGGFKDILDTLSQFISSMTPYQWAILIGALLFFLLIGVIVSFRKKGSSEEDVSGSGGDGALPQSTFSKGDILKEVRRSPSQGNDLSKIESNMRGDHNTSSPTLSKRESMFNREIGGVIKGSDPLQKTTKEVNGGQNSEVPSEMDAALSAQISDADQKRLAKLWPNKYTSNTEVKVETKKETTPADVLEVHPAIISYIVNTRPLGFSDDEIKIELVRVGWKEGDIQNAFRIAK